MSTVVDEPLPHRRTSWSAAELMSLEFPEPRWAVPGFVAEGVTLLAGAPKLGKSWLVLGFGVAVASGGKALGSIDVPEGDVLYLALEDNGRRLQRRLSAVLKGASAPGRLYLATVCKPLPEGGLGRIEAWIDDHPDARMIVVDVFSKVRGATSDRANRYDADYAAIGLLRELADRYGIAIVVVHHTRKAHAEDFIDAVSGTQGLAGAADAVLVLTRSRGAAQAILKVTGRDVEEAEHALDFDGPSGTWHLLDGPASDYAVSDQRRQILQVVRQEEGLTPKAIAIAASIDHGVVKHLVRKMADDGTLDTDGNGHYFAPSFTVHPVHPFTPHGEQSE